MKDKTRRLMMALDIALTVGLGIYVAYKYYRKKKLTRGMSVRGKVVDKEGLRERFKQRRAQASAQKHYPQPV